MSSTTRSLSSVDLESSVGSSQGASDGSQLVGGTLESEKCILNVPDGISDEEILGYFTLDQSSKCYPVQRHVILTCFRRKVLRDLPPNIDWSRFINDKINDTEDTLLHLSFRSNNFEVVKLLLKAVGVNALSMNKSVHGHVQSPIDVQCRCQKCIEVINEYPNLPKGALCKCIKCVKARDDCAVLYFKHLIRTNSEHGFRNAILHSQDMAEVVMRNCWEFVSTAREPPQSKNCCSWVENGGGRITTEFGSMKYPICDILRMYPTIIENLLTELDKKIRVVDFHENASLSSADTKVMLDFSPLLPFTSSNQLSNKLENLKEQQTDLLMELIEMDSSIRKVLLRHPLVEAFLYLKWHQVKNFRFAGLVFYFFMALFMSFHVLHIHLGKCRIWPDLNETKLFNSTRYPARNKTIKHNFFLLLQNPPPLLTLKDKPFCEFDGLTYFFWIILGVQIILMIVFEINHFRHFCKGKTGCVSFHKVRYLLEVIYLFCALVTCIPVTAIKLEWTWFQYYQYQASGFGLLLVWVLLLVQVSTYKKFSIYVDMLLKVISNFIKCIFALSCLLIGFVFCNLTLFSNFAPTETALRSLLKTMAGLLGELSYQDDFYRDVREVDGDLMSKHLLLYPFSSHMYYIIFILVCCMAVMNLMIGLAVGDVEAVRRHAKRRMLRRMAKEIYLMEKFISEENLLRYLPKLKEYLIGKIILEADQQQSQGSGRHVTSGGSAALAGTLSGPRLLAPVVTGSGISPGIGTTSVTGLANTTTKDALIRIIWPNKPNEEELREDMKFRIFLCAKRNASLNQGVETQTLTWLEQNQIDQELCRLFFDE